MGLSKLGIRKKMKKTFILVTILLFLNLAVAFILNVLANKIADQIAVPRNYIPIAALFSLVIALVLGLLLEYRGHLLNIQSINLRDLLLSRVITMFPTALVVGTISAYMCNIIIPFGNQMVLFRMRLRGIGVGPWNYELLAYVIGLITLFVIARLKKSLVLTMAYSAGFATSVPIVFSALYPGDEPYLGVTVITWNVLIIGAGLIMHANTVNTVKRTLDKTAAFLASPR